MRMPASLQRLADYGLIDEVIRPLMSGKEAQIYLVVSQGQTRVAKVYREAEHRNFKHRSEYTEGRTTRNTRDQRAMAKRTRYGREQDEAAWRAAEVDMIYRLSHAGVRVPTPYHFVDSVLIMELVQTADGDPAPRLGDLDLGPDEAAVVYEKLIQEVIRMLCAGVVHGDLSDFNVLMDEDGPVIIDFPQSVDATANSGARRLLLRDVENLHTFIRRSMPNVRPKPYAQEMWELFQRGELTPDTRLRGHFKAPSRKVDTGDVIDLVRDADADEQRRRGRQGDARGAVRSTQADAGQSSSGEGEGVAAPPPRRRQEIIIKQSSDSGQSSRRGGQRNRRAPEPRPARPQPQAQPQSQVRSQASDGTRTEGDRPRRRRRGGRGAGGEQHAAQGEGQRGPQAEQGTQGPQGPQGPRNQRAQQGQGQAGDRAQQTPQSPENQQGQKRRRRRRGGQRSHGQQAEQAPHKGVPQQTRSQQHTPEGAREGTGDAPRPQPDPDGAPRRRRRRRPRKPLDPAA